MKVLNADLHIHTCLSPCADLDMNPRSIVERSLEVGMDFIAVCDHNSAENVGAVIKEGLKRGINVIPGMEINSKEEVHILSLFDTEDQVMEMQDVVYENLHGSNRPDFFGDQVIVNELNEVESFNDRLLIGATLLTLDEIVSEVHRLQGLCIASHVDRPSYSIISQLGFVPQDLALDALEVSHHMDMNKLIDEVPDSERFPVVRSSDAHFLRDIGSSFTSFYIETPGLDEIRKAFHGQSGRRVIN